MYRETCCSRNGAVGRDRSSRRRRCRGVLMGATVAETGRSMDPRPSPALDHGVLYNDGLLQGRDAHMNELKRFAGYTIATVIIIGFVIFLARFGDESGTLLVSVGVLVVIVLPVVVSIFMGRRDHARRLREDADRID